jgi:hypothetical protein
VPAPAPRAAEPVQPPSTGVLRPGGSNAAQALRCQPPRQIINGVCACRHGWTGANCDIDVSVR